MFMCMTVAIAMTSCSSDDEPNDNDDEIDAPAVELPLPSSIVDGVRVESIPGLIDISYNSDGSIDKVDYDGSTYEFVYEGSRATQTGRKLVMIKSKRTNLDDDEKEEGYSDSWIATNFEFTEDGFIAAYQERNKQKWATTGAWEETIVQVYVSYGYYKEGSLDRHITGLNASGYGKFFDPEEGYETAQGKYSIDYFYKGLNLERTRFEAGDENEKNVTETTYKYSNLSYPNTYNCTTPQLGIGMAGGFSPIAYIFATLGYLGFPSANLPEEFTSRSWETDWTGNIDDIGDVETYGPFKIDYKLNSLFMIKEINCTINGTLYSRLPIYFTTED